MYGRFLALTGTVFGLVAFGPAQGAETLTPQQISEQLVGKTLVGRNNLSGHKPSRPVVMQLKPDGTVELEVGQNRNWSDSGHWHLSDTGFCITWVKLRGGQEQCLTVQRDGDVYRTVHVGGEPRLELRVQ